INQGVPEVHGIITVLPKKSFFKWENNIKPVYVLFYLFYPFLLPSPEFWGDIVEDPYPEMFNILRDSQIKTRIVDKDNNIGFDCIYLAAAFSKICLHFPDIDQHFPCSHEGCLAIVFEQLSPGLFHHIASPARDICMRISREQVPEKV